MTEFRIYYECLEQAHHYLKPMIEVAADKSDTVVLIKRLKRAGQFPKGSLFAIQSLTTPDNLITAVKDNKEYPLTIIEITEAVETEDHELQRTYGAVAAYLANCFYIKISGHKKSEKVFGGAEYNPFSTPKIFQELGYTGYILADWQTENEFTLQRNTFFPGCPPIIPILEDTLKSIISAFKKQGEDWYLEALEDLKQTISFKIYLEEVSRATGTNDLLKSWKEREERNKNLNKLRYFVRPDWVGAKINRFSHAMDPDRGILTFISLVYSGYRKAFGIYALVRPNGGETLKRDMNSLTSLKEKFLTAIEKDKGGVPTWFTDELQAVVNSAQNQKQEIDFQLVWEKHKNKISENKVIATLAYFLDGIYLNHNGIKLTWDRRKLLGGSNGQIIDLIKSFFGFSQLSKPVNIIEETIEVDEDEVTYAIVHRVLLLNNFRIISLSYPGAQGGGAILTNPELGKSQPREYPDIIALPPEKNSKIDVIMNESKGMFSKASIEKDLEKMLRYKTDTKLQTALKETLVVAQVIDQNDSVKNITIGVAFGVKSNTPTTWNPDEVDFIFRITDRKKWAIGIFNQALHDLIPTIEGETLFPIVYKIEKHSG